MELRSRRWQGSLMIKIAAALGLVALGDVLFFQNERFGGWFGLYGLGLIAALVLARPAVRRDWRALAALFFAGFYALAFARDPSPLSFLLFWIAMGLATLLPATARFGDGWRWFQRLLVHALKAIFGPLADLLRLARVRRRRPAAAPSLRRSLPTLILPLVGSAVILLLFAAANPVIEAALERLAIPEPSESSLGRLVMWAALFVMIWGVLRPRRARHVLATFDGTGDLALPGVSTASILLSLIAFNLLFAMQNAMDAAWLWGLMALPEGMTLAEYAHRGAYPLILTALLAALFVLVTLRPGSATAANPLIRRLVALWIGQNVVLVASSALRTLDYVDAYSLTRLRIAALLWMGLVAVGLLLILWRMLKGKSASWLINANLASAGLLLSAVCLVDLGAVAAQWNTRNAREIDGDGAALDLCYLHELGGSALLPLARLERQAAPGEFRTRVSRVRMRVQWTVERDLSQGEWSWLAERRLAQVHRELGAGARLAPMLPYNCEGVAIEPEPPVDAATPAIPSPGLTGGEER
ncbi:MAG: DUF4173 domain-containing protein [Novosphingobium sp.]|nr:DUF4173 domain-containing protein [Novosphingobium sp.]